MPRADLPVSMLSRIDALRREHPEVLISAPYNNASGMWEVREPAALRSSWSKGVEMISALEKRYGSPEALREVQEFIAVRPELSVVSPEDSLSGRWTVSFPRSGGTASFDSAAMVLLCLHLASG
jgi:uncharacterized phage-like protein YoqJ